MLYKVTESGLSFLCLFCVIYYVCSIRQFLQYHAKCLAGKNVSEVKYFCVEQQIKP